MALKKKPARRAKPGPKMPKPYTPAELVDGLDGLVDVVTIFLKYKEDPSKSTMKKSEAADLIALGQLLLDRRDPRRRLARELAIASVQLANGVTFGEAFAVAEEILKRKLPRTPTLRGTIKAKTHRTKLGKVHAIFRILAKGVDCRPTFDNHGAPRGPLKRLLVEALHAGEPEPPSK